MVVQLRISPGTEAMISSHQSPNTSAMAAAPAGKFWIGPPA